MTLNIDIDIGNTRSKWSIASGSKNVVVGCTAKPIAEVASEITASFAEHDMNGAAVSRIRVACVRSQQEKDALACALHAAFAVGAEFAQTTAEAGGVINSYLQPHTMGVDRWSAIAAAAALMQAQAKPQPFCIVDAGSAVTLDFVSAAGVHCGGYITPGYYLQLKALLAGTQKVMAGEQASVELIAPGSNTSDAVHAGIAASIVAHIERGVAQFKMTQGASPQVFITGGDAELLQGLSGLPMLHRPHLVLSGLAQLLP